MPSQLFPKFLGAESKPSRNGFDNSKRDVFSTKVGLLNVAKRIHMMPGSEMSIDVRHLLRTDNIQTAAFARFNCDYDFYKVNYNDIYSGYNQYIAQREDRQLASTPDTDYLPSFNLNRFVSWVLPYATLDYIIDHPISLDSGVSFGIFYANISSYPHQEKSYTIGYDASLNRSVALDIVRNLDMMGYGNFLPNIIAWYQNFTDCLNQVDFEQNPLDEWTGFVYKRDKVYYFDVTAVDTFIQELISYLENISYTNDFISSGLVGSYFFSIARDIDLNLWVPCAYNKIFDNHYRNPYYDFKFEIFVSVSLNGAYLTSGSSKFDYVQLFNLDDVVSDYFEDQDNMVRLFAIFAMKLHMYPKDIFTGLLPSTQFGDVSVFTDDRSWLSLDSDIDENHNTNVFLGIPIGSTDVHSSNSQSGYDERKFRFDPALAISVLNQRRADALQRFNENMLRAGNRTKSIFRAHFGYEPKSEQGHEAYYLGSFDGQIDLNTVTSTATTSDGVLGEQGSTGVGVVSGKTIHVKSDDFCVVLGIFSISKPTEYDSYGIDRFNEILDKWDVPYSELQNISLAPLSRMRLNANSPLFGESSVPEILGYLPRFIEYKSQVDEIHGEFYTNYPFLYNHEYSVDRLSFRRGLFCNFVTPKSLMDFPDEVRFLYIQPDSADNIFYNVSNACQDSDQFKVNMQCDVKSVHPLSVIGLPY